MNLEEAKNVIKSTKVVLRSLGDLLEVVNSINENEFRTDFQRAIGVSLVSWIWKYWDLYIENSLI